MSKWVTKKVSEIGEVISGATPKTNEFKYWDGDIIWITPNDMSKLRTPFVNTSLRKISQSGLANCSAHLLPKGTLVLSSRAPIGYLAVTRTELATNQGCKSIIFFKENDPLFHYYNFLQNIDRLKQLGEGTTFSEFSKAYLENFTVSYPADPAEQARIAKILSTVDAAIEQTEALIAKYSRIRTGLMQDLLTRGIDEQGRIRSEETHEFKDSPLGRIPVEWEVAKLGKACSHIQDGTHFSPKTDESGDFMYLTSKNIRFGYLDLNKCEYISEKSHNEIYRRCSVIYGDILLTKDGANTGNVAKNTLKEPFSLLSSVSILRGNKGYLENEYLLWYLLSDEMQSTIVDSMAGNAIPRITLQKIKNFDVCIPPIVEQQRITETLEKYQKQIDTAKLNLLKLQTLKKGLMQDLLSGPLPTTT